MVCGQSGKGRYSLTSFGSLTVVPPMLFDKVLKKHLRWTDKFTICVAVKRSEVRYLQS